MRHSRFYLVFFALLILCPPAFAQLAVPKFAGYVTDEANLLTADQIASLNQKLSEYEQTTSNQIAVLTIKSLEGLDIASYGIAVSDSWKVGQKNKENGVILLIAPHDRKVRIEVGYGLEGVLTDAKSAQIIRDKIAPRFRENNFYGGMTDAIMAIEAVIGGEYKADPKIHKTDASYFAVIMTLIFLAGLAGLKHWTAGTVTGAFLAGGFHVFSGISGISLIPAILLGLLLGSSAPFLIRNLFDVSGRQNRYGGGGWSGGRGHFNVGGSGGFGGFGGGGFGGGGASGGW